MKRRPKFKCRCARCNAPCIVTPCDPTTKAEREAMAKEYVCSTCTDRP